MFSKVSRNLLRTSINRGYKIAVIGASGGCGQPISLLLKTNPKVTELLLFDIKGKGVSTDLSHICTPAKVTEHISPNVADFSFLKGTEIIVIPAGCPRAANEDPLILSRDSLFDANAPMIHKLATGVAKHCPKAMVLIITNPVNSLTPLFAEVMKQKGVYDPKRIFGVCTLDIVRANTFVAENQGLDVQRINVPVIGGHGGSTILPLLSQVNGAHFTPADIESLTDRVKHGGDEVVRAKAGDGSATLSLAFAVARFTNRLMDAMKGVKNVVECAYVQNVLETPSFLSTPLLLGPNGVEKVLPWGKLSAYEQEKWDAELPLLTEQVKRGVDYAVNHAKDDKY